MEKICKRCGKVYPAERHLSRYCSPTCRQYAYLERHGLAIKNESGKNNSEVFPESKKPEPMNESTPVNNNTNLDNVTDLNDTIPKMETTAKNYSENKSQESGTKKETVNPINDVSSQLGELMQEIKSLREQVNDQAAQKSKSFTENKKKSFDELLEERMQNSYGGENMFNQNEFYYWNRFDFKYANYVNERIKSHFFALLKLHKQERIETERIKFISEKMDELKKSFEYNQLPQDYPYRNLIAEVADKLLRMVLRIEEQDVKELEFSIPKELRVELKAAILEIGTTVPDIDHSTAPPKKPFSQNRYYLAAKRKGFDILKDI